MTALSGVHRTHVHWVDTDAAGIHHNTSIARWAEAAEADLMRGVGLTGYFPVAPRVRYEADFTASLRPGDEVGATVTVERMGRTSLTLGFEVWGGPAGQPAVLAARGRYVTVHVDAAGGGPSPWPATWRSALDPDGTATDAVDEP
ncbi:acyl-CoA thioesterase [Nakamurella flava]|uniref:acyl-CoA thioesterase n=1 Tax=Nakamurella flava TaxID=2576308 RepID=UPI00197B9984|nr:thioesterase family protein [Nakamurella flava]